MTQSLTADWRPIGLIDTMELFAARVAAHYAVQWLGRFGRANVAPAADDSHTALTWNADLGALTSGVATVGDSTVQVSFSFRDFALLIHSGDAIAERIPLDGQSDEEVGVWMSGALAALYVNQHWDMPLPYDMPPSDLTGARAYDSSSIQSGLNYLDTLFRNAAEVFDSLRKSEGRALPVRCWPHHFDIASLIAIDAQTSEDARSIGVGLSPGDETYREPYFYVTPWPYPDADRLAPLPQPGQWHTEGFVGAILEMPDLALETDQRSALSAFLTAALDQSAALLGDTP